MKSIIQAILIQIGKTDELKDLEKYFDHTKPKIIEVSQARIWIEIAKEMKWKSPELYDVIVLLFLHTKRYVRT